MAATSSIDLPQAAHRYLKIEVDGLQGKSAAKLARDIFADFLAAAPSAVAALKRSADVEVRKSAQQLESAVKNLASVDPANVRPAPPSPTVPKAAPLPTLEEWIRAYEAEHPHIDLGEFGEGDLLEMYRDELGIDLPVVPEEPDLPSPSPAPSPASGDPVTVARDFMFLAGLVAEDPSPADACSRWLAPSIAAALLGAPEKVATLNELSAFIRRHGHRWWTRVPGIGVARAMRVYTWLVELEAEESYRTPSPPLPFPRGHKESEAELKDLGIAEAVYGLQLDAKARSRFPKRQGIAPVEFLALQPSLEEDVALAGAWLSQLPPKTSTLRVYHLALERLVIWLHIRGTTSLSTLQPSDLREFEAHLREPGPHWCTHLRPHRNDSTWRPMKATVKGQRGLSGASLAVNLAALRAFYRWSRHQGWTADPFVERQASAAG